MVETPLVFDFNNTQTVCDAFDDAWALLQDVGRTSRHHPSHARRKQFWPSAS